MQLLKLGKEGSRQLALALFPEAAAFLKCVLSLSQHSIMRRQFHFLCFFFGGGGVGLLLCY